MVAIPEAVLEKMKAETTVKAIVTADAAGQPHGIVAGTIMAPAPDKIIIGEVLMKRTVANLNANAKAAIMVVAGMEAYEIQIANPVRIDSGEALDNMNKALEAIHLHANAMWMFDVVAVYNESASPEAGKQIA